MQPECSKNTGLTCDDIETCEPSRNLDLSESMSSSGDSLAKTLATPERGRALQESVVGFGPKCSGWFASYDRVSSSWKTSQRCLVEGWAPFLETWPETGLMRNGTCYRLVSLAGPTQEKEFSLWPTPTRSDAIRGKMSVASCRKSFVRKSSDWLTGEAQGNLSEHLAAELGLSLGPAFSEWMMGFPIDWTALESSETQSRPILPNGSAAE